jgi:MerC mercury resistance protein
MLIKNFAGHMVEQLIKEGRLDRWAIALSGLCFAHCLLTAAIITAAGSATILPVFSNPIIHEIGLLLAIVLGALALGFGLRSHGRIGPASIGALGIAMMIGAIASGHGPLEIPLTMAGVLLLAGAHIWNRRSAAS